MGKQIYVAHVCVLLALTAGCARSARRISWQLWDSRNSTPRYVWYVRGTDQPELIRFDVEAKSSSVVLDGSTGLAPPMGWPVASLSPGGTKLAYEQVDDSAVILDLVSGESAALGVEGFGPQWLRTDNKVVFNRSIDGGKNVISTMDLSGRNVHDLITTSGVAISASRSGLLLLRRDNAGIEFAIYNPHDGTERIIARGGLVNWAGISPDGKRVFLAEYVSPSEQVRHVDSFRIRIVSVQDKSEWAFQEQNGMIPQGVAAWAGDDTLVFVGVDLGDAQSWINKAMKGVYSSASKGFGDLTFTVYAYSIKRREFAPLLSDKLIYYLLPTG